jgi:hypothetical protein
MKSRTSRLAGTSPKRPRRLRDPDGEDSASAIDENGTFRSFPE